MARLGETQEIADMLERLSTLGATIAMVALLSIGMKSANAATYGFHAITNNSGIAADVADQLSVKVTGSTGEATFTFYNAVGIASSLTDIYLEDTVSLFHSITAIDQSSGVSFLEDATPPNLSGGGPYAFRANFSADADPEVVGSGVDHADEWVSVALQMMQGVDLDDVLVALQPGNGLRIGLRVQSINGVDGDSFMSPSPVPLPASLLLFLTGLAGIGVLGRSKVKRRALAVG